MYKVRRILIRALAVILVLWTLATFFVQATGEAIHFVVGDPVSSNKALVVFDPDPIYDLDVRVCRAYAEGLTSRDWSVTVASVAALDEVEDEFDLYTFCTNTYNWAPDWAVSRYIRQQPSLGGKNVVAITLGSGSTKRAERQLKQLLEEKEGNVLRSVSLYLMRPNDESRLDESNVEVAVQLAQQLGEEVAGQRPRL